jgi:hypothetical protein
MLYFVHSSIKLDFAHFLSSSSDRGFHINIIIIFKMYLYTDYIFNNFFKKMKLCRNSIFVELKLKLLSNRDRQDDHKQDESLESYLIHCII